MYLRILIFEKKFYRPPFTDFLDQNFLDPLFGAGGVRSDPPVKSAVFIVERTFLGLNTLKNYFRIIKIIYIPIGTLFGPYLAIRSSFQLFPRGVESDPPPALSQFF